jgi:hypothetical protein
VHYRLDEPDASWTRMQEGMRFWVENDLASGLARGLGMASIVLFRYGDPELAARVAAVTYKLAREKSVMVAPVKVLHLPDPADLAVAAFGPERAAELLSEDAAPPLIETVEAILAMRGPTASGTATTASGAATTGG